MSQMGDGVRRLLTEILRFLAVGGVATAVSVLGFNALVHGALIGGAPMRHQPIAAYVLVNAAGGLIAYLGLWLWAFSHREVEDQVQGIVRFFALGVATMAIPVLFLTVSRYGFGLTGPWADNLSANVLGLGVSTAVRFWVFRRYVFEERTASPVAS